ncbi:MAG: cell division ATPase MinD [archaeon]
MTRIIGITSGKGGVGKTTTTVNLATALTALDKSVIIVDANLTTPNIGLHLGMPLSGVTLHDVLDGDAFITEAITIHPSTGVRVVPAGLNIDNLNRLNYNMLGSTIFDLLGYADFILVDCPAGLDVGSQKVIQACEEVLIVTNPELPAVTDALKAKKFAETNAHVLGIVLNKVRHVKSEMTVSEIEQIIESPVAVIVPHDDRVQESISKKVPLLELAPNSPASKEWRRLARLIEGLEFEDVLPSDIGGMKRFFAKLFRRG